MNILLIIRAEFACFIILLLLFIYSVTYCRQEDRARFLRLCLFGIGHVIFDGITVYTVNSLETVPEMANRVCHIVFYLFALLFCYEFFCYVLYLSFSREFAAKVSRITQAVPVAFLVISPFLRIDYLHGRGTNYSFGPCVFVGYGIAASIFLASALIIVFHFRKLAPNVRASLFPTVMCMLLAVITQIAVPELLFTGVDVTLVTVGTYFAIENPAGRYRERALMDLNTSVKNRNCYDQDVAALKAKYGDGKVSGEVAWVVCDLDELKKINDRHGHLTGDEALRLAACVLRSELKHAYGVYRIGGDEFAAIYLDKPEPLVVSEIKEAKKARDASGTKCGLVLRFSMGYAFSAGDRSLVEIIEAADQKMYEDKKARKQADML